MPKIKFNIEDYYNQIRNASEQFYVCYKALGWEVTHGWVSKSSDVLETLEHLVAQAIQYLDKGEQQGSVATGGFVVSYFKSDDSVEISIQLELESFYKYK